MELKGAFRISALIGGLCLFGFMDVIQQEDGLIRRVLSAKASHDEPVTFDEDGTLVIGHAHHEDQTCRYFTDVPGKERYDLDGKEIKALHYHFKDCYEQQLGTRLGEHFTHQLLADIAGIPYTMSCGNPQEGKGDRHLFEHRSFTGESVLKHLEVNRRTAAVNPMIKSWTVQDLCTRCNALSWWCPVGPQYLDAREQMQKVIDPSIEPSDAVIHLRLGDALTGTKDRGVGLLPFRSYVRLLKQAQNLKDTPIKSIAVLTQSFDKKFTRVHDTNQIERSRLIVAHFADFLSTHFPDAHINVYNEGQHTPRDAYTRLMVARVAAVCGATTFCTYPTIANKNGAYGFLFASEKYAPWTVNAIPQYAHLKSWKAPRLANSYIDNLSNEQLVHWLKEQSPDGDEIITDPPLFRDPKPMEEETMSLEEDRL